MSIKFGVGTIVMRTDGIASGLAVTTGTSAVTAQNLQVATGNIWIEGVSVQVVAQSASFTAAGARCTLGNKVHLLPQPVPVVPVL